MLVTQKIKNHHR